MDFKDRLARAIELSGKTQREVADESGLSQSQVSHYLHGIEPRRASLDALMSALPQLRKLEVEALKR